MWSFEDGGHQEPSLRELWAALEADDEAVQPGSHLVIFRLD